MTLVELTLLREAKAALEASPPLHSSRCYYDPAGTYGCNCGALKTSRGINTALEKLNALLNYTVGSNATPVDPYDTDMLVRAEDLNGHVEEYPCDCMAEDGQYVCWIVRHPKLKPAISFPTKREADEELERLRGL